MSPRSWPLFCVYIYRFHFGLAAVAPPLPVRVPRQPGLLATPFHGAASALLLARAALARGVFFPLRPSAFRPGLSAQLRAAFFHALGVFSSVQPFAVQPGLSARPLCALARPRVFFALRLCAAPPPV